jgi:hypothetical protein
MPEGGSLCQETGKVIRGSSSVHNPQPRGEHTNAEADALMAGLEHASSPEARVTTTALEVLVQPDSGARISSLVLEVVHSVQEAQPPPPAGRRRPLVIVMG